jgi:hypothetical protein
MEFPSTGKQTLRGPLAKPYRAGAARRATQFRGRLWQAGAVAAPDRDVLVASYRCDDEVDTADAGDRLGELRTGG